MKKYVYIVFGLLVAVLSVQWFLLVNVFIEPFHILYFTMIWIVVTVVMWWSVKVSFVLDKKLGWWLRGFSVFLFIVAAWSFYATRADAERVCLCYSEPRDKVCRDWLSAFNLSPYYSLELSGCKTEGKR